MLLSERDGASLRSVGDLVVRLGPRDVAIVRIGPDRRKCLAPAASDVEVPRRSLAERRWSAPPDAFEIVRSLPHGHVAAVLGCCAISIWSGCPAVSVCRERHLVLVMVRQRLIEPCS